MTANLRSHQQPEPNTPPDWWLSSAEPFRSILELRSTIYRSELRGTKLTRLGVLLALISTLGMVSTASVAGLLNHPELTSLISYSGLILSSLYLIVLGLEIRHKDIQTSSELWLALLG